MKSPVFTGTCTALITPFHASGAIDYAAFGRQIDRQLEAGVDALCVCGTTGESAALTLQEHIQLVDFCVSHVAGRCPVIAGSGSNGTDNALYLCQHAQESGADALLLVTPYYNKTTQAGLIHHYTYLADHTDLPIILYNVPSRTGLSFTAETYRVLSQHPRINGTKEASGDFSLLADTMALCGEQLNVWCGNDDHTLAMLAMGAKGLVSVVSNLAPSPMVQLTHSFFRGEMETARILQLDYTLLTRALFSQVNPIPIKAAMEAAGLDSGILRLPLWPMDAEPRKNLLDMMEGMGLLQ